MPLEPYKKKRDFKNTPEPAGDGAVATDGKLHFVIQKHQASHLHYDFRLENHGVLRSWAVPKGPSMDHAVKRLAMEVEDHPIDYQHFEGTIPEGNYGAGTVMIWDNGEYFVDEQLSAKDNDKKIAEDLAKGHLNFYLNGKKLHGKFTLFKLRGRKGNEWLLMKKTDEYANKPIPHENESVVSGRTLEEIGTQKTKTWKSNKAAARKPVEKKGAKVPKKK